MEDTKEKVFLKLRYRDRLVDVVRLLMVAAVETITTMGEVAVLI